MEPSESASYGRTAAEISDRIMALYGQGLHRLDMARELQREVFPRVKLSRIKTVIDRTIEMNTECGRGRAAQRLENIESMVYEILNLLQILVAKKRLPEGIIERRLAEIKTSQERVQSITEELSLFPNKTFQKGDPRAKLAGTKGHVARGRNKLLAEMFKLYGEQKTPSPDLDGA